MPRYFFDVNDGTEQRDEVGRVLEGVETLRARALQLAAALAKVEADDANEAVFVMTVRDEAGALPFRVRMVCQIEEL